MFYPRPLRAEPAISVSSSCAGSRSVPTHDRSPMETAIGSPWHGGSRHLPDPALEGEIEVDVAVVGAGIVGLTTALAPPAHAAPTVAVLEAREVAAAASGNNTAKVSALQGLAYSTLVARDLDAATDYARANERGIAADLRARRRACDRVLAPAVIQLHVRRGSARTATRSSARLRPPAPPGLDACFVESTPLPFEAYAVRLDEQVELDPVAYLRGLADALDRAEQPAVFERARVRSIGGGSVRTEDRIGARRPGRARDASADRRSRRTVHTGRAAGILRGHRARSGPRARGHVHRCVRASTRCAP